jgi:hypothetical protein
MALASANLLACISSHFQQIIRPLRLVLLSLTRLFHTDSAAACEHLTDTALASNCSSGSMKHRAVVATHHLPCLHQDSQLPRYDQYEISGLTRIFHTNHLRRPGSQMDAALDSHFDLDSMYTYSPASKYSSALPHQPSRSPRHDQYEISGLISSTGYYL